VAWRRSRALARVSNWVLAKPVGKAPFTGLEVPIS
jgi:hypothetical protein